MSRSLRVGLVSVAGIGAALFAYSVVGGQWPVLIVLAAAIIVGELVELRPAGRSPLPLAFAVVTVLVRAANAAEFCAVVVFAETVASAIHPDLVGWGDRALRWAERIAAALAAGACYRAVIEIADAGESRGVVLTALGASAMAAIVVHDAVEYARTVRWAPMRRRGADVALVTSGILMAVGYRGIEGEGRLGLWGPILFSIPLFAAWYSFELLASTRRNFRQTIRALAAAPELGGIVQPGHAERVATLASEMAEELELSAEEIDDLETAALLHHLGAVCLDEPSEGNRLDPAAVATATATMLRASEVLANAGDVVAAEPLLHRPPESGGPAAALPGMVLKVASAFDELTQGESEHAAWAVEALYTGPGYVYDGRVLAALERALERRGALELLR